MDSEREHSRAASLLHRLVTTLVRIIWPAAPDATTTPEPQVTAAPGTARPVIFPDYIRVDVEGADGLWMVRITDVKRDGTYIRHAHLTPGAAREYAAVCLAIAAKQPPGAEKVRDGWLRNAAELQRVADTVDAIRRAAPRE